MQISDFIVKQTEQSGQKIDPTAKEHTDVVDNIFQHEDKDEDGHISHEEFSGPKHDEL